MKNDKGLSLVELLVSIVILSIVIVSFMSFFSQSMKSSRIIEEKLAAINIAEAILSNAKKNPEETLKLLMEQQIELNKKNYYAEISITQSSEEKKLALKRIQVKIFNTKEHNSSLKPVTVIYGYAQVGGV